MFLHKVPNSPFFVRCTCLNKRDDALRTNGLYVCVRTVPLNPHVYKKGRRDKRIRVGVRLSLVCTCHILPLPTLSSALRLSPIIFHSLFSYPSFGKFSETGGSNSSPLG